MSEPVKLSEILKDVVKEIQDKEENNG